MHLIQEKNGSMSLANVKRWALMMSVLDDVLKERKRQEWLREQGKFSWTCATVNREVKPSDKYAVLAEEVGEVAREIVEGLPEGVGVDKAKLREELVQVAAVCVAWVEALDAETSR